MFKFVPKLLMISINEKYNRIVASTGIFVTNARGGISVLLEWSTSTSIRSNINILSGNKFSWYTEHPDENYGSTYQMNITGCSYSYISLG